MTVQSWFPTQIYYAPLKAKSLEAFNQELEEECYKIQEFDIEGQQWSRSRYVGGYTSFSSLAELHKMSSTFMDLEKAISKHVHKFASHLDMDLGEGELKMTECWLNIMPAQTTHSMHIHPLSVISGTYYVKTPRSVAGIKFEDPRLDKFMAAPPKKEACNKRNKQIATYKAKAGQLVLFESWLRHEVPAALNKVDRISISFNFNWL